MAINRESLAVGIVFGAVIGVLMTTSVASHAGLFNIFTTTDWETLPTIKQKVDVKGEDMRIYTWVAPLNSSYGCSMMFANAGSQAVCFPIDSESAAIKMGEK